MQTNLIILTVYISSMMLMYVLFLKYIRGKIKPITFLASLGVFFVFNTFITLSVQSILPM